MLEWKRINTGIYSAQGRGFRFLVENLHQEIGGAPLWGVKVDGTRLGTVYRWLATAKAVANQIEQGQKHLRYR